MNRYSVLYLLLFIKLHPLNTQSAYAPITIHPNSKVSPPSIRSTGSPFELNINRLTFEIYELDKKANNIIKQHSYLLIKYFKFDTPEQDTNSNISSDTYIYLHNLTLYALFIRMEDISKEDINIKSIPSLLKRIINKKINCHIFKKWKQKIFELKFHTTRTKKNDKILNFIEIYKNKMNIISKSNHVYEVDFMLYLRSKYQREPISNTPLLEVDQFELAPGEFMAIELPVFIERLQKTICDMTTKSTQNVIITTFLNNVINQSNSVWKAYNKLIDQFNVWIEKRDGNDKSLNRKDRSIRNSDRLNPHHTLSPVQQVRAPGSNMDQSQHKTPDSTSDDINHINYRSYPIDAKKLVTTDYRNRSLPQIPGPTCSPPNIQTNHATVVGKLDGPPLKQQGNIQFDSNLGHEMRVGGDNRNNLNKSISTTPPPDCLTNLKENYLSCNDTILSGSTVTEELVIENINGKKELFPIHPPIVAQSHIPYSSFDTKQIIYDECDHKVFPNVYCKINTPRRQFKQESFNQNNNSMYKINMNNLDSNDGDNYVSTGADVNYKKAILNTDDQVNVSLKHAPEAESPETYLPDENSSEYDIYDDIYDVIPTCKDEKSDGNIDDNKFEIRDLTPATIYPDNDNNITDNVVVLEKDFVSAEVQELNKQEANDLEEIRPTEELHKKVQVVKIVVENDNKFEVGDLTITTIYPDNDNNITNNIVGVENDVVREEVQSSNKQEANDFEEIYPKEELGKKAQVVKIVGGNDTVDHRENGNDPSKQRLFIIFVIWALFIGLLFVVTTVSIKRFFSMDIEIIQPITLV